MTITQPKASAERTPRILVVDDEPAILEIFRDAVAPQMECQLIAAASVAEARKAMARQEIDLLVTDVILPDGSGLALLADLKRMRPTATGLVVTGAASLQSAIEALRGGAADFLPKPFSATELTLRVSKALVDQQQKERQQKRALKLRAAFKRLHAARRIVTKRVDLLCNDLISAYGDLSRQFDTVRMQESYRQFLDRATGLEQLLCHNMDWLLRQVGYCNIGIWLAGGDQDLQLGAYMKYTMAAEPDLVEAMQQNLLRMAMRRGFVRLREPEVKSHLTPTELKHLASQEILAINCTYLGETLGIMVLFRDHKTPFHEEDVAALKTISPLFALALARTVRACQEESEDAPLSDDQKPKAKKDPADWWKTGEEPPF